jgi:hypothetical protein
MRASVSAASRPSSANHLSFARSQSSAWSSIRHVPTN